MESLRAFVCPITHDIMEDPVIAGDGHTYERRAIIRWLEHHDTSPTTNLQLHTTTLLPNIALRKAIQDFRALQSGEAQEASEGAKRPASALAPHC
mmetsp:Transcript_36242/g.102121  ORF Transcript_36242/g.102121 Transcript_36242/m.102121 type:complete len:95 (+) Transcript_36242:3-287(+)